MVWACNGEKIVMLSSKMPLRGTYYDNTPNAIFHGSMNSNFEAKIVTFLIYDPNSEAVLTHTDNLYLLGKKMRYNVCTGKPHFSLYKIGGGGAHCLDWLT